MSEWQGKPKYWEETCPSDAVADQHMTWSGYELRPPRWEAGG
jgi:hypothetical protein